MSIFEKLQAVQTELKVPKGQYNDFGKYKYRSCEDILEAVKPVLAIHKAAITVGDDLYATGDRYYVKAVASFIDVESGEKLQNTAYAREPEAKKGMDESQITGTASSYARKYALGGLLLIDDTKDADTNEYTEQVRGKPSPEAEAPATPKATAKQIEIIKKLVQDQTAMLQYYGVNTVEELSIKQASEVIAKKGRKNNG